MIYDTIFQRAGNRQLNSFVFRLHEHVGRIFRNQKTPFVTKTICFDVEVEKKKENLGHLTTIFKHLFWVTYP